MYCMSVKNMRFEVKRGELWKLGSYSGVWGVNNSCLVMLSFPCFTKHQPYIQAFSSWSLDLAQNFVTLAYGYHNSFSNFMTFCPKSSEQEKNGCVLG